MSCTNWHNFMQTAISDRPVHSSELLLLKVYYRKHLISLPGLIAQSVMCLATDACLTADPGVTSSIPARSHTFAEIDHEIISCHSPPFC